MKVKVFKTEYHYIEADSYKDLLVGVTDWEEVPEEDVILLQKNGYVVVQQLSEKEVLVKLSEIKATILKQEEARKKDAERVAKMRKQREATLLQKKLEKAKKLLKEHNAGH